MRRTLPACSAAAAALLTACSGGSSTSGSPTPSTTSPAPSSSPSADPYSQLTPPDSPGVGSFDSGVANHAYLVAQGLLAEVLLERDTLTGANAAQLGTDLAGSSKSPSVLTAAAGPPTAAGLRLRPRFGPGVTVPASFAEVVKSQWGGEEVGSPDGGTVLKVDWTGSVRYRLLYKGSPIEVAFALATSWVFTPATVEINGVRLVTAVPGTSHAAPQVAACTAKGLLVPVGPPPTTADFGPGPYAAGGPGACPA